jgi:hypothetical protein
MVAGLMQFFGFLRNAEARRLRKIFHLERQFKLDNTRGGGTISSVFVRHKLAIYSLFTRYKLAIYSLQDRRNDDHITAIFPLSKPSDQ